MKIKPYLFDAFIGLVSGILFFFVLPPLMYKGEFGIVGADFISKTFSSSPGLLTVGVVYSFLGAIIFVLARTLLIKRKHDIGIKKQHFLFWGLAFFSGACASYLLFLMFLGYAASRLLS